MRIETDKYLLELSDGDILYGDYWVYICPINGLDYGDNGNPIVRNNLPQSWFERLHDRSNYKLVIAHTPKNGVEVLDGVELIK